MIGAALFYGDAVITPAVSVLSAVEGLKLVTPGHRRRRRPDRARHPRSRCSPCNRAEPARDRPLLRPLTVALVPAMAVAGIWHVAGDLSVFAAFNPLYAIAFFGRPRRRLIVLGIGLPGRHRRRGALRRPRAFRAQANPPRLVRPRLPGARPQLSRAGGARADRPRRGDNPFFRLVPEWAILPMVGLATMATIIAAQAVITGAFSLTRAGDPARPAAPHADRAHLRDAGRPDLHPAHQLDAPVRRRPDHLVFENSSNLAAAYGIAVSGTMWSRPASPSW